MGKTYEELITATGGRVEQMEEAMQMLTPGDAGKGFFQKMHRLYEKFSRTADMEIFETMSSALYGLTGYRI